MDNTRTALVMVSGLIVGALILGGDAAAKDDVKGAQAQAEPVPVAYEEQLVTAPVMVEDIDKKNRTLIVRDVDGQKSTVRVPPDVQRFDQLKKGDKIELAYYRAVAVSVVPHSTASAGTAQRHPVAGPAEVVSVNKRDKTIQVKGDDGKTQTVSAQDAAVGKKMQTLKPGDAIEIIYTEAVATSILPSAR
jgi:hypothetical protein